MIKIKDEQALFKMLAFIYKEGEEVQTNDECVENMLYHLVANMDTVVDSPSLLEIYNTLSKLVEQQNQKQFALDFINVNEALSNAYDIIARNGYI